MGFAEDMIAPCECCVKVPDALTDDQVVLIEPMGVALDLVKTADIHLTQDVLVMGLGPIGLMAARIVYICSPYAGDIAGNVDAARRYSRFAVGKGYIPIAPHLLYPQFLDDADPDERELGIFFGNAIMSKCSEVWVFGSRISAGMQAEIRRAKWKSYRLRYFTEDCQEV